MINYVPAIIRIGPAKLAIKVTHYPLEHAQPKPPVLPLMHTVVNSQMASVLNATRDIMSTLQPPNV